MDSAELQDFGTRYAAAWSSQDPALLASFYGGGGTLKVNDGEPSVGRAAVTETARSFMTGFPDMLVVMDSVIPADGGAVFHWTWTGTNTGPGGTGLPVRISGYEEWTFGPDGLIAQSLGHYDEAEYQRQMTPAKDSVFAAMQSRGQVAMGVDQYSSSHVFESLPDGGRIELQRDTIDAPGTAAIREHMRDIAARFAAGDFAIPGFVHAQAVPGTDVMRARRERIRYFPDTLPRGGMVRILTTDPAAVAAVHAFLEFQRTEHRAPGHSHPPQP